MISQTAQYIRHTASAGQENPSHTQTATSVKCRSPCDQRYPQVQSRLVAMLGVTVFNCLHDQVPLDFVELCQPVAGVASWQHLRSAIRQLLVVPRHRLSFYGRWAFCVAGLSVWNSLPDNLRNPIIGGNTRNSFRQFLKTFLFETY